MYACLPERQPERIRGREAEFCCFPACFSASLRCCGGGCSAREEEEKVFILLCVCWGVSVWWVCAFMQCVCVCGSVLECVCASVLGLFVYVCVCVPVTGLVSLILPSVAGAPRSSFSRAMTRSEIVMKLLIYRSLLCESSQTGGIQHTSEQM